MDHICPSPPGSTESTADPAGHPPTLGTGRTGRRRLLDPWLATTVAMSMLFMAAPKIDLVHPDTRAFLTDSLSTIVLMALAVGAVLHGAGRRGTRRERYFWRLLGIGLSGWLAGEAIALFLLDPENASTGTAVDGLFLCYYLAYVLALDVEPQHADRPLRIRPLRVLASAGRVLFVSGLFGYFVLLPRLLGVDEYLTWVPSFVFYVLLDLYLTGRLAYAARFASTRRWRFVLTVLAGAAALVFVTDLVELAWISGVLPELPSHGANLAWYAPMILIVVAARWQSLLPHESLRSAAAEDDDEEDRVRGVPLLVYSVGFAVIHLVASALHPDIGVLDSSRVALVILWLLLFGVLNVIQQRVIQRQNRRLSRRRKDAEDRIRTLSLQDPLTGLYNRRALEAELSRAVARATRHGTTLGLMFIDLDHFKAVNDTYGHRAGDSVLREAAARMRALTREDDTLARYGGDEFVLLFESMEDPGDAEVVGRRILDGFVMGFQFESGRIELSASIGIALLPAKGRTPAQLFEAADRAMYSVKESGGAGLAFA